MTANKREAAAIADQRIQQLRELPYDALVARLLDDLEVQEVRGPSGVEYQIEIQAFWDDEGAGALRVQLDVDDGALHGGLFSRGVGRQFVVARAGSFVGE